MRIISGSAKGHKILCPKGKGTRPTGDRVREAVFSILGERVVGARVLDLYSGTGAMGLEALSRGADEAVFVERDPRALKYLTANIESCGLKIRSRVVARAVLPFLKTADLGSGFDIVFADPPYSGSEGSLTLSALSKRAKSLQRSLVVLEHSPGNAPGTAPDDMEPVDTRRYGNVCLAFYTFRDPEAC
ncbi:MAG: 16S rRNA (guanine(966)-N(2))-methyltransferase RsmD [bacterium]|nr:16S rRNA (guanine(966)-N(2))-methyltransferase RsmD [bacterium]MDT8395988.1 16S rRNA (guanine(966)-N(2))-methyltransferase RsmD [bacterium]